MKLGVRQPALYCHVESHSDLIRNLGLRGRKILARRLADATIGVSGCEAVPRSTKQPTRSPPP
ncbi:MAG: hypothetical protein OEU32_14780 [Acidimicrobiia bacterium]|nr:hypothetical protein [Acidimicrobiia bacterium]